MKVYRVEIGGKTYSVRIVEDRGSSIVVDVDGRIIEVSIATAPPAVETGPATTAVQAAKPAQTQPSTAVAAEKPERRAEEKPAVTAAPAPAAAPAAAPKPVTAKPGAEVVTAKVPGKIIKILVKPGDMVELNQTVLTMESMKMEIEIKAPKAGRVSQVRVKPGDYVNTGDPLLVIEG